MHRGSLPQNTVDGCHLEGKAARGHYRVPISHWVKAVKGKCVEGCPAHKPSEPPHVHQGNSHSQRW